MIRSWRRWVCLASVGGHAGCKKFTELLAPVGPSWPCSICWVAAGPRAFSGNSVRFHFLQRVAHALRRDVAQRAEQASGRAMWSWHRVGRARRGVSAHQKRRGFSRIPHATSQLGCRMGAPHQILTNLQSCRSTPSGSELKCRRQMTRRAVVPSLSKPARRLH